VSLLFTPGAVGVEVPTTRAISARLPDREFGHLPLRSLSLRPRQRRANQPSMHGAVIVGRPRHVVVRLGGVIRGCQRTGRRHDRGRSFLDAATCLHELVIVD
jgi:hypothetical protein